MVRIVTVVTLPFVQRIFTEISKRKMVKGKEKVEKISKISLHFS